MTSTILVVDDDPVQRRLLEAAVTRAGHAVRLADGGKAAVAILDGAERDTIALVILDLMMPDLDGLGVMAAMRERGIVIPVIVQTAQGGIDTVISAMRAGAFDFVVKPVSPERLQGAIAKALKVEAVDLRMRSTPKREDRARGFSDLITASPAMAGVLRLGRKAAQSTIPILIEGESGVGKEVMARAIQAESERADRPFVTVNCGAIPDNLVESILFGHEKGSFTGATEKHAGKFAEADGGTLFLDEIGDLPLEVQVKLLRAVQQGEIETVGGRGGRRVDIRLISATNRDLAERVREGRFREDLFYRLNVFPIRVPPLRERREDIPGLVRHFIDRIVANGEGTVGSISARALAVLQAYDWPGNIRQLENAVFRAVVLCDGDMLTPDEFPQIQAQVEGIDPQLLAADAGPEPMAETFVPRHVQNVATDVPVRALDDRGNVRTLSEVEFDMIRFAIDRYKGQMSEVARRLGIGRSTLYRKLKEYGIDPDTGRPDRLAS